MSHQINGRYINEFGDAYWYKNGLFHREDGPAVECSDGDKYWYKNALKHREDGPAIERWNGKKEWWINDVQYTEDEFNQWLAKKHLNEKLHSTLQEKPSERKVKI